MKMDIGEEILTKNLIFRVRERLWELKKTWRYSQFAKEASMLLEKKSQKQEKKINGQSSPRHYLTEDRDR